MAERPSEIWKDLPADKREAAALAFWRDNESPEIHMQHAEAAFAIARRLNFRPKSVAGLSIERRARALAQMAAVSDSVATRALIAYHFGLQRPLMGAFLDALGIAHDEGLITEERVDPPAADVIQKAVASLAPTEDMADLALYLRTLAALDGDTWVNLAGQIPALDQSRTGPASGRPGT